VCTTRINITFLVIKTNRMLNMGHVVRVSEIRSFEGIV